MTRNTLQRPFWATGPLDIEVHRRRSSGRIRWFVAGVAIGAIAVQLGPILAALRSLL